MTATLDSFTLLLGTKGSGKTTLLQKIEGDYLRLPDARSVIWDRMGHWPTKAGRTVIRGASRADAERAALKAVELAPCVLFLDECMWALPRNGPPPDSALEELVITGRQAQAVGPYARHGPVAIVAATQRPAMLWTTAREVASRVILMRFEPQARNDLKWIEEATSPEHARLCTTFRAEPPLQYIVVDKG